MAQSTVNVISEDKILAETLRATLLERINEAQTTQGRIDHDSVMEDARAIIENAKVKK